MQEAKAKLESGIIRVDAAYEQKQRRKMMLALLLMVVALVVVLVKDRSFWFGSSDTQMADFDTPDEPITLPIAPATLVPPAAAKTDAPAIPAPVAAKPKKQPGHKIVAQRVEPPQPPPAIVASNRTALPPLEVEVVAGDNHRTMNPHSNSMRVDMPNNAIPASAPAATPETVAAASPSVPAAERVKMSADAGHVLQHKVDPSYPMLARQMKVQGSVVLQALISRDGLIQDLHVLSGPGILSSAAQEAVRQWRFRPYLQNGAAVETEANITVNFTISTF
jgi:periplasmic protein TonB